MQFYTDEIDGDVMVLKVDGGLNEQTASEFVHKIEALVEGGLKKIIIDCQDLTHVSSYGLGILIRLHHRMAKHGGDVKIANVHGVTAQALRMTRLDRVFDVYPDVDQARLAFGDGDSNGGGPNAEARQPEETRSKS